MISSCSVTADSSMILSFFIIGCFLTIIGYLLNICSCLLFCRTKSLFNTPYAVFIIAISISDIIKLTAEYLVHVLFIYIKHPYFVCSITWFLTMTSENTSYAFLCALGVERNIKIWTTDRRWFITRRHACSISFLIILFVIIYDHPFLFWPYEASYCYFTIFNHSTLYTCNDAYYHAYGQSYSLTDLIFIESIGLNNFILPLIIVLTNIMLLWGLKRRSYRRCHRLGRNRPDDWRERSVLIYMLVSCFVFIFLTAPVGILVALGIIRGEHIPTNNFVLICDLMEIVHHCSHFPILLLTSSKIRKKFFGHYRQRPSVLSTNRSMRTRTWTKSSE